MNIRIGTDRGADLLLPGDRRRVARDDAFGRRPGRPPAGVPGSVRRRPASPCPAGYTRRSDARMARGYRPRRGRRPVLVIDNYDSFVFNLVQYLGELGAEPLVHRHDALTLDEIVEALDPDAVLISPGPGRPEDAGCRNDGHPRASPGVMPDPRRVPRPPVHRPGLRRHGRAGARRSCTARPRWSTTTARACFAGLPDPFEATRYHSLVVDPDSVPRCSRSRPGPTTAWSWALRHRELRRRGRAVPPRVDPHRRRPRPAAQLPGPGGARSPPPEARSPWSSSRRRWSSWSTPAVDCRR